MQALTAAARERCAQTPRPAPTRCSRPTPRCPASCSSNRSSRRCRRPCRAKSGKPYGWQSPQAWATFGELDVLARPARARPEHDRVPAVHERVPARGRGSSEPARALAAATSARTARRARATSGSPRATEPPRPPPPPRAPAAARTRTPPGSRAHSRPPARAPARPPAPPASARIRAAIADERLGLQQAVRERVAGVRVEAARDQDQLGLERPRRRHDDTVEQLHPQLRPGAGRHGQVDRVALARAAARRPRADPCPGTAATGACEANSTSLRVRKISAVPLPWWTSQSSTNTRCEPELRRARSRPPRRRCRTRRSPSRGRVRRGGPRAGSRSRRRGASPASSARAISHVAAGRVQRGGPGLRDDGRVGVDQAPTRVAQVAHLAHVLGRVHQLELGRRSRREPARRSQPSQSRCGKRRFEGQDPLGRVGVPAA